MSLFLTLQGEQQQRVLSNLLGGDDHQLRLKLNDEEFLSPLIPRRARRQSTGCPYTRHVHARDRLGLPAHDNKNFRMILDVQQFTPEEIAVRCVNEDTIVVECQHVEKPDEHGYVSRHFVRKYKVPKGHDVTKCMSKLSSDGVLTVIVPNTEKHHKSEIDIPIIFINQPIQVEHGDAQTVPINISRVMHNKDVQTAPLSHFKSSASPIGKRASASQDRLVETLVAPNIKDEVKKNKKN